MKNMLEYLKNNLLRGLKVSPFRAPLKSLIPVPVYLCASLVIGFHAGLFSVGVIDYPMSIILPFSLFVFPSLLVSTAAFVLWHPANALTINTTASALFLNPAFLLIVALLGITCSVSYVLSRSLWTPIIIHWLTVVIWVIFLGGRNKLLEL